MSTCTAPSDSDSHETCDLEPISSAGSIHPKLVPSAAEIVASSALTSQFARFNAGNTLLRFPLRPPGVFTPRLVPKGERRLGVCTK